MVEDYPSNERGKLLPLFKNHPYLQALSEAILKEGLGLAFVNEIENPTVALLIHRGVVFLSGDANNPSVPEMLAQVSQKFLIFVPPGEWENRIKLHWGDKLKPYPRTKFSSEDLDINSLQSILKKLPEGMVIEEVTNESIQHISNQARGIVTLLFPSLEKFMETNFGFIIRKGDTIVSLALAGSPLYNKEFEIHIETHPDYQKRGLAMIVGAKVILYSLENGMTPHWDADNPPSARLATKLGFTKPQKYNAFYWLQ